MTNNIISLFIQKCAVKEIFGFSIEFIPTSFHFYMVTSMPFRP